MAADEITRPSPMYMQVADTLAESIKTGDYEAGALLPSEAQMIERYGVSRATVRAALAELRAMGLVVSRHGKGTIVRGGRTLGASVDRTITRHGERWQLPPLDEITPPTVTRTRLDGAAAELLNHPTDDALSVERLLRHPENGARLGHRVFIPLAVAAEAELADTPETPVAELYQRLADAGHRLSFTEHVTARTPYPDERRTLGLADTAPLLITYRVTYGNDQAPLLCEELRAPAAACQLTYPLQPRTAPDRTPETDRD